MKLSQNKHSRSAFTLVELLVVLVIVLILVGLISAVVASALGKAKQARNRQDISQLETAVNSFKTKYGVLPPSRLKLAEHYSLYDPSQQIDLDSLQFLGTMFPRITNQWSAPVPQGGGIDWNGNGQIDAGAVILNGSECLVFLLGGIPSPQGNLLGFSTNPSNPATQTVDRIGPFFDFKVKQLAPSPWNPLSGLYVYLDTYGTQPYVYFSSYKTLNGYNRYGNSDIGAPLVISPYIEVLPTTLAPVKYVNPGTFQIISAGPDGVFGPGGAFRVPKAQSPNGTADFYLDSTPGYDDQANFHQGLLGTIE